MSTTPITRIKGSWYPAKSAAQFAATLYIQSDQYTIETENGQSFYGALSSLDVSPRLGNIERKLILSDGSTFTCSDNDAVDSLLKPRGNTGGFIHALESRLAWVIVALVVTIFSGFAFFKWGVPWASTQIAHALPHKTNELIASNTLEFLDEYLFDESQLEEQRQEQIRSHFNTQLVPLEGDTEITYTLHFRDWSQDGNSIPNAFALPSGDIILTDKFVELSEHQNEISSVLLHEMGHVAHRHTLQMVIQGTFVTALVMVVTGDNSAIVDFGLGLGSLLVSSNYSRNHESEADDYAFKKMLLANIDPEYFSTIMARITDYMAVDESQANAKEVGQEEHKEGEAITDYLSTHPSTAKRIEQARRYSECFKQGLRVCP